VSTTVKGKYPWMMFYPSDHRADPAVRMCSIAARGLWVEILCLMHEAEPYGHLLSKGTPISNRQLAMVVGVSEIEIEPLLAELENHSVFSRDDSGVMYSRRMVRDFRKRERNAENGKRGGNPRLMGRVKPSVKPRDKVQRPETIGPNSDSHNAKIVTPESDREREPSLSEIEFFEKTIALEGEAHLSTCIKPEWKPSVVAIAASFALGMTRNDIDAELRKFIFRHKEKGSASMDWDATWGNWCERWKEFNPTRAVSLAIVGMPKKFHVKEGTSQWAAWARHLGKAPPMDRQFGRWFDSEWPTDHEPEVVTEGVSEKNEVNPQRGATNE
jgi:hypothetical protein